MREKVVRLYYIYYSYLIAAHYNYRPDVHVESFLMMHRRSHRLLPRKLGPYWKLLALAFCAIFISAATVAALPLFIQRLLDSIFIQQDLTLVQGTLLATLMLFVIRSLADYMSSHSAARASDQLGTDVRIELFEKLLTLPVNDYRQLDDSNEIDALISQIHHVTQSTVKNIATAIHASLTIVGLMLCLFFLNREFFVLLLFIGPLLMLNVHITRGHLSKLSQRKEAASANLSNHVHQSIKHYREIRLNEGQTQESQRLGKIAQSFYQEEIRRSSIGAIIKPIGELITALIIAAVVYFFTQQIFDHSLTIADAGALVTAAALLIGPLGRIADLVKIWQEHKQDSEPLGLFLNRESEEDSGTVYLKPILGKLEFKQLRAQENMGSKPVLGPINLVIKAGETIVFTGYTDDEKNTVIDLILRMQQPSSGSLLLDDHPLNDIVLGCLHSSIGIVSKNGRVLSGSIAGNIAYGKMRCSHESPITAAAQASHAMSFIREMPEGLQTRVGEGQVQLTPVQCHYIAVARNFLKNPSIMILDELPTLDAPDAGHLLSALDKLTHQRTTLIFNRHIPPLKKIDRIVVLENGCITKNLTHMRSSNHGSTQVNAD